MTRWAARGVALICAAVAAFQLSLSLGAPLGWMAWGGTSDVLPDTLRMASAAAAVFLLLAAAAILVRAGDWGRSLPQAPFRWFNALLVVQFALNTAANLAAKSPAERYGMGAVTALATILSLAAFLGRQNDVAARP